MWNVFRICSYMRRYGQKCLGAAEKWMVHAVEYPVQSQILLDIGGQILIRISDLSKVI